ncbi:glutamyl-tRNA amidotransferase [Stappia sp. F7233]|uniref:Glutamyl-tRNA amidotransferase n=1 Tax=Stappia albiluteola TaxID=2758565 RepID=A0A839AC53_9HYPH|nr:amidase family protein [Stappia albiluteola]MBA5776705.1 glutamyl-tRNA amidotransferase [Stappia albiluteola]
MGTIVEKARSAIARVESMGDRATGIFTEFDPQRILDDAARAETAVEGSSRALPLAGMLVSVKDLFDEAGYRTTAGSRLLADQPPAGADSDVVARMKAAGAVMFGRTAMSEFAYSGVGLNPHHGTPGNALDASRIPGGSTSGGALTVALGICDIALGTDTGGSVRIPAAANGIYGFKPSQSAVSRQGVHPLSQTLDSVGPLAGDLTTTIDAFEVMSGGRRPSAKSRREPLRLAKPRGALTNELDEPIADAFDDACENIAKHGHEIREIELGFLQDALFVNKIIVSVEAHAIYAGSLHRLEEVGDPRVLKRIRFAETLSKTEIQDAYRLRADTVRRFGEVLTGFDGLLAPTLQILTPTIADTEADFDRLNAAMLRNPSLINLADGCAITMPVGGGGGGQAHALMIAGSSGTDWRILDIAETLRPMLPA